MQNYGVNIIEDGLKPDFIIFDLDGTLSKRGNMARAVESLKAEWLAVAVIKGLHGIYKPAQIFKQAVLPMNLGLQNFKRSVLSHISKPDESLQYFAQYLQDSGIKTGILSNNSRYAWASRLQRHLDFGIQSDIQLYREDVPKPKPDPRGLIQCVEQLAALNVSSKKSKPGARQTGWFIGDGYDDVLAAVNAADKTEHKIIPVALGDENSNAARFARALKQEQHPSLVFAELVDVMYELMERDQAYVNKDKGFINPLYNIEPVASEYIYKITPDDDGSEGRRITKDANLTVFRSIDNKDFRVEL